MTVQHYSVLLEESVDALIQNPDGIYIDGTFGRGGHSAEMLNRLGSSGSLIAFDKDPSALVVAGEFSDRDARFEIVHDSFAQMGPELHRRTQMVDGVLLDLGVSSPQLDNAERGFSFLRDGPLDMRMDNSQGLTAAQWIAETDVVQMMRVFRNYGEERFAKRIANNIKEAREESAITTTLELANIIESSVPKKEHKKHPATRVFQAIRIEINRELKDLELALEGAMSILKPGGRIVVISFHSLEDRIVKRFFKKFSQSQDFPLGVPVTHDKLKAPLKLIGRAIKASEEELEQNVRSRSAVMRIAERSDVSI